MAECIQYSKNVDFEKCANLQSSETADLVERLEDAQMALGSMASNKFGAPFRSEIISWLGKLGVVNEQVPT